MIVFQWMSYVFMDFVTFTERKSNKPVSLADKDHRINPQMKKIFNSDPVVEFPNLLSALLEGLSTIIHKFKLKWPECLETINILYSAQNILSHSNVSSKVKKKASALQQLDFLRIYLFDTEH